VKKVFLYFLILMISSSALQAQTKEVHKLSFQDSVRVVMENNTSTEAAAVGGSFATAWQKLTLDQQDLIMRLSKALHKKKYKPFPLYSDFYGSIGFAVEIEHADTERLTAFLKVATQVIEKQNGSKTAAFFHYTRDFFEYHALHYEKSYRLYIKEDEYSFDYINEPGTEVQDTTKTTDNFNQWDKNNPSQDNNTVWKDEDTTKVAESTPAWLQPPPQPVLSGPVLKFEVVTFNMATPYDSAVIKNTHGSVSLLDGTFVGEKGSFGWDPAGLSSD